MGSERHVKNLSISWFGYAANFIILMFLSRLVVRSLGNELFGVWSLIVSVTGYMGWADIGLRNGLGRFINFYQGKGETHKVNEVISTAMTFFWLLVIPVFLASWFIGDTFCWFFPKVPVDLAEGSMYAMLLTGLNLWLGFISSPYSLVVMSQERFDLLKLTDLVVLGIRAAGTVIVMKGDNPGIVELAAVQVLSNLAALVIFFVMAHAVYKPLKIRLSMANMLQFRELFGFSFWAFLSAIATKLLYFTDIIVIGAILGPVAVTLYSIPLTLIDHSRNFVGQVTEVLTPRTIKMSSRNDFPSLQLMLKWGSKFTMFFAIPFFTGLMFFGPKFMALFWGKEFWDSKWVLVLLVVPQYTAMAVRIGGSIISGLGHIRIGASISLLQGVVNLGFTLVFVLWFKMGIEGVALGTLVPMVIFNTVIVFLLHKWVHGSVRKFFTSNVSRWLLSLGGMLIFGYASKLLAIDSAKYFGAFWDGWVRFGLGALFYAIGAMIISWFLGFHKHERLILMSEISTMLPWNRKRQVK